jgi:hypothetical protein
MHSSIFIWTADSKPPPVEFIDASTVHSKSKPHPRRSNGA